MVGAQERLVHPYCGMAQSCKRYNIFYAYKYIARYRYHGWNDKVIISTRLGWNLVTN